jgi:hypothetical protein
MMNAGLKGRQIISLPATHTSWSGHACTPDLVILVTCKLSFVDVVAEIYLKYTNTGYCYGVVIYKASYAVRPFYDLLYVPI